MRKIDIDEAPAALGPYSQAIAIASGQALLFVSGQLPIDPRTGELLQGDIRALTRQTLDNLEAILQASGSSLFEIVKTEIFLKDLKDFAAMNEEYGKRVNPQSPPARQTIQVADLPRGSPIEISCIALCGSSKTI